MKISPCNWVEVQQSLKVTWSLPECSQTAQPACWWIFCIKQNRLCVVHSGKVPAAQYYCTLPETSSHCTSFILPMVSLLHRKICVFLKTWRNSSQNSAWYWKGWMKGSDKLCSPLKQSLGITQASFLPTDPPCFSLVSASGAAGLQGLCWLLPTAPGEWRFCHLGWRGASLGLQRHFWGWMWWVYLQQKIWQTQSLHQ